MTDLSEDARLKPLSEHLFAFADTCNVYLVTDADAGLVIDAGSGAVADHVADAGVGSLEWVLHTHHHRDQCWGTPRLVAEHGTRVAVPEHERYLFASAREHWRTKRIFDNYNDRNTFFAPAADIPVDAVLEDYEEFRWRGYRFFVLPAKGHTFGSSALLAEIDGRLVAFTGDLSPLAGTSTNSTRWSTATATCSGCYSRSNPSRRCAATTRRSSCPLMVPRCKTSPATSTACRSG